MDIPLCFHCNINKAQTSRRGLCDPCYRMPRIRNLYKKDGRIVKQPCKMGGATGRRVCNRKEPTMEEVEQMIQENLPTMPERIHDMDDPEDAPKPISIHRIKSDRRMNGYHLR